MALQRSGTTQPASFNTAIGADAIRENTTTDCNVAVGDSALTAFNGTTATDGANTALGSIALIALTSGQENVAVGRRALEFATSGSNNTTVGWRAGDGLTTGDGNTFLGTQAGANEGPDVSNVVCIGTLAIPKLPGRLLITEPISVTFVGVSTGGSSATVPVVNRSAMVNSARQFPRAGSKKTLNRWIKPAKPS